MRCVIIFVFRSVDRHAIKRSHASLIRTMCTVTQQDLERIIHHSPSKMANSCGKVTGISRIGVLSPTSEENTEF